MFRDFVRVDSLSMARPLRTEFAGALYHVTSRGDGRDDIYLDDEDRKLWLDVLEHVCQRFNWIVHAYCQMGNHILCEAPHKKCSGISAQARHGGYGG